MSTKIEYKIRQLDWERLGPAVCDLARQAGVKIMEIYNGTTDAWVALKPDESPLTAADLAAHQCIVQGLAVLTPEIPVVSEECLDSLRYRLPTSRFWLVDPLDGTKEFLARNGEFTVNIALIEYGVPIWGVVYAPALNLLYWGGRAFGAHKSSFGKCERLRVATLYAHDLAMRVVASKSHLNAETKAFIDSLGSVSLVQAGSSLKFCLVAEGLADVYPRLGPTCEWDTAAAHAIVEGAGGFVMDIEGHDLTYGKAEVLNPSFVVASLSLNELVRRG
jgi:3'(2'), 5'-bisphosphate nucleotidase